MSKLLEIPYPSDPFARLNPQQRAAVEHGEGPLLVIAGAGTGKTRVITERIRALLDADPELEGARILGLTFTDKAAGEMKYRVVRDAGERGKGVWLGTFHGFCQHILTEIEPGMQVLDPVEHWILLRRNMAELGLQQYRKLAEPGQFLRDFVEFFSRCQDELVTPDDYEAYVAGLRKAYAGEKAQLDRDARGEREKQLAQQEEVARVYRTSERLLRERGQMTFGRMLLEAVRKLQSDSALLSRLQQRYRYILVDEFQDTNIAQLDLLWLLARDHRNIVAVGDDDQAIYRFRGASFGSFTIFLDKFAAGLAKRPIAPLTLNYRSAGRILRTAGQVIALNERSAALPKKELTPRKPDGEKVRLVELGSAEEEAQWVAQEIERLHDAGVSWHKCAVLYRLHTHRDRLVDALTARGIPFVIRKLSILSNPLLRDVLAYLRLIATPWDNVACARVLAAPGWGLAPGDLVRLAERASKSRAISLWDTLETAQRELPFRGNAVQVSELVAFVKSFQKRAPHLLATELLDELLGKLDVGVVATESDRKYIARFAKFVHEWEAKNEEKRLAAFVEYLDYFEQAGGQIELEEDLDSDAVQLMTVHAAKGLEFDHVFVMHIVRNAFPWKPRARVLEFPEALMKEERPHGDYQIQEERRLFYVALTRARDRLALTTVHNKHSKPSLFWDDILQNAGFARAHVQQLAPKVAVPAGADEAARALAREKTLFTAASEQAHIYSRVAHWAETYHPPVFEPLQLSASAIDAYVSCPQRYLFEHVWKIRGGPHASMSFGSVMHTTIKHFIGELRKGRRVGFDEVEAIFLREWTSAGFEDDYQEGEYKKDGLEQLRAFHTSTIAAPPDVIAQEKAFTLPLENNVVITGRMDQVNRAGKGQEEIVDYKTGRPKLEEAAAKSLQLSLYALAAREVLDYNPVRLVFYNLQTNEAVSTSREEKQLNKARADVQEVAADIRAGKFPVKPGFACRSCEYRPICPAYEKLVALEPASR